MKKNDVSTRKIFATLDYGKFKFLKCNRAIRNVRKLEKSIKQIDLTDCCPIVVDYDFRIIDGQHRFEICRKNGMPIYYVIFEGDAETAMKSLNISATVWRQEEWFEYHCGKGENHYLKLRDFMQKYPKLGISNAILLFSGGNTNSKKFKEGRLVSNNPDKEKIADFLYECNHPSAFARPFVHAVMAFLNLHGDHDLRKLQKKIICVPSFSRIKDYLTAFDNLTNKK